MDIISYGVVFLILWFVFTLVLLKNVDMYDVLDKAMVGMIGFIGALLWPLTLIGIIFVRSATQLSNK